MTAEITEPQIVQRGPYSIIGVYAAYQGDDEGPAWEKASAKLERRKGQVPNRVGDTLLAFLYRPHKDDPSIPEEIRTCFMGLEVADLAQVPEGMAATRFSGGRYVTVQCIGSTEMDAAVAVGEAIARLETWMAEHDHREGDACFCFSHETAETPPFVQHVYINLKEPA